mgnify:CR=1 FL=1
MERLKRQYAMYSFQVASIVTTTGFATTDFDLWPGFFKVNSIMSDGSGCLCRKYRRRL